MKKRWNTMGCTEYTTGGRTACAYESMHVLINRSSLRGHMQRTKNDRFPCMVSLNDAVKTLVPSTAP